MASIALGNHFEEFVKKQVESGRYNNSSEVVRAGLRLLEDSEQSREKWLTEEVANRLRELQADPSIGVPADKAFSELETRYRPRGGKAG